MDLNVLPHPYSKDVEGAETYGEDYGVKIIPIDLSSKNVKGYVAGQSIIILD